MVCHRVQPGAPAISYKLIATKNGSDSAYLVPGTWYLAPVPNSPFQILTEHYSIRFGIGMRV
jgi:hypothetical protein